MGLLVAFAILFGAALTVMCLIRLPAGVLLRVRGRSLTALLFSSIGYLAFAIVVALVIGWLVQRMAFIKTDTLFWDGDSERTVFGLRMRYVLLLTFIVLPTTLFDALLLKRTQRVVGNATVWSVFSVRNVAGWTCLVVANCILPFAIVVAGDLITEVVYAGY